MEVILKAQGNTMADMHYDQKEIHVPAGSTIKLVFINESTDNTMLHNFVLIEEGTADAVAKAGLTAGADKNYAPVSSQVLVSTTVLNPKAKTELTFPAPEKGTYDFICSYPGHYQKMNGKFFVD
jgi:azurin